MIMVKKEIMKVIFKEKTMISLKIRSIITSIWNTN
jgi:hypothetical protein